MHFNFTSLCTSILEGDELWNWILIAHSNPKAPAFFFVLQNYTSKQQLFTFMLYPNKLLKNHMTVKE
uniref:Putative ovule protein n=1 Tax=Solanum chacoense TaxID=4108 RepID=A0A0V0H5A0_SOLCH